MWMHNHMQKSVTIPQIFERKPYRTLSIKGLLVLNTCLRAAENKHLIKLNKLILLLMHNQM